jgi:hypothetical protein
MYPIQKRLTQDGLSPLLAKFAFEYTSQKKTRVGLKLNGMDQLPIFAHFYWDNTRRY